MNSNDCNCEDTEQLQEVCNRRGNEGNKKHMKTRREWKRDARGTLRRHYFINVLVVFLVTMLLHGGYSYTSRFQPVSQIGNIITFAKDKDKISNAEILEELFQNIWKVDVHAETTGKTYTRGVLAVFVNEVTATKSFGFGILNGINKIVFQGKIAASVTIFVMAVLYLLFQIFIGNAMLVGQSRYFLENRRYERTKPNSILSIYRMGMTRHVAWIMLFRYVYQILWDLTIVGGFVKYYEYAMIPYLLAENPSISRKDAFALSKQLMKGQKWNTFKLDCTLIPWYVVGAFTYNLTTVFFLDPYRACIYTELYMNLREEKMAELQQTEWIADRLLDIPEPIDAAYPEEGYVIPFSEKRKWLFMEEYPVDYQKTYSLTTCILLFFTFSFAGWIWEVFLALVSTGEFANRGTMFGPWLPIYGTGGVLVLVCLQRLREKPLLLFSGTMILAGFIEYMTAWILETFWHEQWWDYSGYFLNLHGRICLEGLLVFGFAGVTATYLFAPLFANICNRISITIRKRVCVILLILFAIDFGYSVMHPNIGEGITTVVDARE